MSHPHNNPFSPHYVSQLKIEPTKYKRPVINQPPVNARMFLNEDELKIPTFEIYKRISKASI